MVQSNQYQKSKWVNSSTAMVGKLLEIKHSFISYIGLKAENQLLSSENIILKNQLQKLFSQKEKIRTNFTYISANVISNNYRSINNFLIINKGSLEGIETDMGVINSKGIVGIVENTSKHYATVISVLSYIIKINARIKNNHYFGSLHWRGGDYTKIILSDLEPHTPVKIGDTVVTGGKSYIFPDGIPIGVVNRFISKQKDGVDVEVDLFNDMSNLNYVQIIKNNDKKEIDKLIEKSINQ